MAGPVSGVLGGGSGAVVLGGTTGLLLRATGGVEGAFGRGGAGVRGTTAAGGAFFCAGLRLRLLCCLSALAAVLASLRACLANFFACLYALRASLNLSLANRASLRAVSACFSASAALPARYAAFCLFGRSIFLEWLLFIVFTWLSRLVKTASQGVAGFRFVTNL